MVSTSGDIYSESAWETWPNKTYAYGYQIYTESGNINASLLHGGWTNMTSLYGNTTASVWTGVADHLIGLADEYPLNGIHSFTQSGNTMFRLVGGYISASNLTSQHYVGEGELELRYPDSWCGDIDARIGNGEIRLNATLLSDIQRGDGYVKAKRGEGDSQIEAHVGSGKLDIIIGDGSA